MTSLERFRASLNRKSFDRIPYSFDMVSELRNKFRPLMEQFPQYDRVEDVFECDRGFTSPQYCGNAVRYFEDGSYTNMFGVHMRDVSFGKGSYSESIGYPLKDITSLDEIDSYPWPAAKDFDYSKLTQQMQKNPNLPFTAGYFALGWFSWDMRGMEQFLKDLLLEPELAEKIIRKVWEFGFEYYQKLIVTCREEIKNNFCCIHLADDWATQENLLISPGLFREFFKPYYRSLVELAHKENLLVEFHCCGSAVGLIPELIDIGVDILNPIQTSAKGMNPEYLKKEFGKDIAFSGGIDVQTVMPFGTPKQVREEVFRLLDTMGKDGGYILQPSHCLQIDTPLKNIAALSQAVYEYYGVPAGSLSQIWNWCNQQE